MWSSEVDAAHQFLVSSGMSDGPSTRCKISMHANDRRHGHADVQVGSASETTAAGDLTLNTTYAVSITGFDAENYYAGGRNDKAIFVQLVEGGPVSSLFDIPHRGAE